MLMLKDMPGDRNSNPKTAFDEVLAELPESHREAVRLRHKQGWKLDAIAGELGKSPVEVAGLLLEAAQIAEQRSASTPGGAPTPSGAASDRKRPLGGDASLETQAPPNRYDDTL
ncbi:MAG: sigma factor-like helix-turn-helix DNA-binding protein [Pirellulaceae bacterium]